MKKIFTIGYEGASIQDFKQTLLDAGIDTLLDVRELPISRRRGFSKTALRLALEGEGIQYYHDKRLGSPRPMRNQLRETGDLQTFFQEFRKYLSTQGEALSEAVGQLNGNIALMCYEKDVNTCHRKLVAEEFGSMVRRKPRHLGVNQNGANRGKEAPSLHIGQSLPAT